MLSPGTWEEETAELSIPCQGDPPIDDGRVDPVCWEEELAVGNEAWFEASKIIEEKEREEEPAADVGLAMMRASIEDVIDTTADAAEGQGDGGVDSVECLFDRPCVPLLPRPAVARVAVEKTRDEPGSSARLQRKPKMLVMEMAIGVLKQKMGMHCPEGYLPGMARKAYVNGYGKQLPDPALKALT